MDIATILGLVLCAVFVVVGIVSGDQGVAALGNFKDFTSALVTFGVCMYFGIKYTARIHKRFEKYYHRNQRCKV